MYVSWMRAMFGAERGEVIGDVCAGGVEGGGEDVVDIDGTAGRCPDYG